MTTAVLFQPRNPPTMLPEIPNRLRQHRGQGYWPVTFWVDTKRAEGFQATCVRCGSTALVRNEFGCSPHHVIAKFQRAGWVLREDHPAAFCSLRCEKGPRMTAKPSLSLAASSAAPPAAPVPAAAAGGGRPLERLTPDQKNAIRARLDKHFDDKDGCYLDGMSDQAIATALNLPRAAVSDLRELAYGPIRVDPAVLALRAEIESAERKLEAAIVEQRGVLRELRSKLDRLEREILGSPRA